MDGAHAPSARSARPYRCEDDRNRTPGVRPCLSRSVANVPRYRWMTIDARSHLESLVGDEIRTLAGRPNRVLEIRGDNVIVGTTRSPRGQPVPIRWMQDSMDMLEARGEIPIDVETVGY